jgi:protein-S-isoprenylcysteine O-methyltransferase Ste14
MFTEITFNYLALLWLLSGLLIFGLLFKITAPYGKFISNKWGALVNNRAGWIIMESPPQLLFSYCFWSGQNYTNVVCLTLYLLWMMHYINRDLIFPFRIKTKGKKMPAMIMSFGLIFNGFNTFFNGYYLGHFANYSLDWFYDPRFIIGLLIFVSGFGINIHSDNVLFRIRKNSHDYQIPYGGMYRFVSSPNYLGEMMEWIGFAMMSWSMAALSFAVWTMVNLLPRAISNHKWYKQHFEEYPADRKAIFPFIW